MTTLASEKPDNVKTKDISDHDKFNKEDEKKINDMNTYELKKNDNDNDDIDSGYDSDTGDEDFKELILGWKINCLSNVIILNLLLHLHLEMKINIVVQIVIKVVMLIQIQH